MFLTNTKQVPFECENLNLKIYKNGEPNGNGHLVHIPFEKKTKMTSVLTCIAARVSGNDGYPSYLYTIDGRLVKRPSSLQSGKEYVVAGKYAKSFKRGCYGRARTPLVVFGDNSYHVQNLNLHGRRYDYFQRLKQRGRRAFESEYYSEIDNEIFECKPVTVSKCPEERSVNCRNNTSRKRDCSIVEQHNPKCNTVKDPKTCDEEETARVNKCRTLSNPCPRKCEPDHETCNSPTETKRESNVSDVSNMKGVRTPKTSFDEYESFYTDTWHEYYSNNSVSTGKSDTDILIAELMKLMRVKEGDEKCTQKHGKNSQKNAHHEPKAKNVSINHEERGCSGSGNFKHLDPVHGSKKIFHHDLDSRRGNTSEENHHLARGGTMMMIPPIEEPVPPMRSPVDAISQFKRAKSISVATQSVIKTKSIAVGSQPSSYDTGLWSGVGTTPLLLEHRTGSSISKSPLTGNRGI